MVYETAVTGRDPMWFHRGSYTFTNIKRDALLTSILEDSPYRADAVLN